MGEKKPDSAPKQALYRRYRSTTFDELVGQEHVTDLLKSAVSSGSVSHAYLFTGQRGTGKTSAARILAHAINDLPYSADSTHLDIIEIDAASNRRIDDIRDLREKVFVAPVSAKYKVYIIDEVHMLTGESFNALLKTLEEPPEHAIFILATTELHKVPATIVSRTQRFHFRPVSESKVAKHLETIAKKEGLDIDESALKLVAAHGGGSFRDSISLLDQLGNLGQPITVEIVESLLGRARSADVTDILDALASKNQALLRELLANLSSNGISPVTLSEQLVSALLRGPKNGKEWYSLSEQLMSVPKAHFPQLLLMTLLLGFASDESKTASTEPKKEPAPEPKKEAKEPKPTEVEEPRPKAATKKKEAKADTTPGEPGGEFNWDKILEAVKKTSLALHGALKRAEANFDGSTLTLSFQYALHRKKFDQPQYRTQLSRIIQDTCGLNPQIVIGSSDTQFAADDPAKKVADLMGGGERVRV